MKKQLLYIAGLLMFVLALFGCKDALSPASYTTDSEVKKITIEDVACEIEIKSTDEETLSMDYSELKDKYIYVITMNNQTGSLVIKRKDNRKGFTKSTFTNTAKTIINVPKSFEIELDVNCTAGKLNVDGVNLKDSTIEMNAADISLNNITSDNKIDINVRTGNATLKNLNIKELNCDINTGNYEIKSCNFSEKLSIKGYASKAELNDVKSPNTNIEVTTGEVSYSNVEVLKTLNITVTTGDIEISLLGKKSDYTLTKSAMGSNETLGSGSLIVNLYTRVGEIDVEYLR